MAPTLTDYTSSQTDYMLAMDAARWIKASIVTGGLHDGLALFRDRHPRSLTMQQKAAVNPGTVAEPAWAPPLAQMKPALNAFVRRTHPLTILGRLLGQRSVPFNTGGAFQATSATYAWIGEAAPTPVGNFQLTSTTLGVAKAGGIIVISEELAKAGPYTDTIVLADLERGLVEFLDMQFFDPTLTATTVNPGSILNLGSTVGSTGTSAANAITDWKALTARFFADNPDPTSVYAVMNIRNAVALATAMNSATLTASGGTLHGIPVIVSASAGNRIALVDAGQLLVADAGDLEIDISRDAMVEMSTTPTSPITAASVYVSLFQAGLIGIKCVRTINWKIKPSAATFTNQAYV